jgi:flavin-dependent dehydrogenase
VVGDAARQVNPLTAGGIMNTLEAADLLVQCILKGRRDDPAGALGRYSSVWASTQRRQQKVFAVLKNVVLDCSDDDLVTLLRRAEGLLQGKTDRSKPFAWSVVDVMRMGVWLFGRAWRHWRVLVG